MNDDQIMLHCDKVREQAYDLHHWLRHGHLEKVYENGLRNRLTRLGLEVRQQHPIQVKDRDGSVLGDFVADLFIENELIIELKACRAIADEHTAQLLGYLRASGTRHRLLINFGASRLQLKKFVL